MDRLTAASREMEETLVTCPFCRAAISRKRLKLPTLRVNASARILAVVYR